MKYAVHIRCNNHRTILYFIFAFLLFDTEIPPIKAPVGLAKGPDLKGVRSKIGSLQNVKHKPCGGEKKVVTQKLEWNAKSRVGSFENKSHKAGGGGVKVQNQKLDWKVTSKVGSLENVKHKPGGGDVKIFDEKYARSSSEMGSPHPLRSPSPASSIKSIPKTPPVSVTANNVNGNTLPEKVSALSLGNSNAIKPEEKSATEKTNGLSQN
ncbi:microtubule-associated protein tau-like protein [Leptotrombidium deliense]|uniref:Microtubule-associated protein n=1 Tax=Leptotrombidium deliense TaxID=299467 RepID=A0A443SPN3_9ACAR|nr:microtubule-associated protein tau-like protein [Leptotrombidium deliense]